MDPAENVHDPSILKLKMYGQLNDHDPWIHKNGWSLSHLSFTKFNTRFVWSSMKNTNWDDDFIDSPQDAFCLDDPVACCFESNHSLWYLMVKRPAPLALTNQRIIIIFALDSWLLIWLFCFSVLTEQNSTQEMGLMFQFTTGLAKDDSKGTQNWVQVVSLWTKQVIGLVWEQILVCMEAYYRLNLGKCGLQREGRWST